MKRKLLTIEQMNIAADQGWISDNCIHPEYVPIEDTERVLNRLECQKIAMENQ